MNVLCLNFFGCSPDRKSKKEFLRGLILSRADVLCVIDVSVFSVMASPVKI